VIAPFPPGSPVDLVARVVSARLSEMWGQPIVVDNKLGAAGNLGAEAAARSAPDGYTLYLASFGHAVSPFLYPALRYDPVTDFAPVTLISTQPCFMVVPRSSPAHSVAEFIAYAKANKGKISYGSPGVGTSPHLCGEMLKRMAGIEMAHIPYRTLFTNDLIAGRYDVGFPVASLGLTVMQDGKARGLAVTGTKRLSSASELPTMREAGVSGFDVSSWFGFLVPTGTPHSIITKVHADTVAALGDPTLKARLEQFGITPVGSTPEELDRHINAEMNKWGPVIADAKIKVDG
jgi:tripartite-type tricarboxylate transporter receptor subunit TctC